MSRQGGPFVVVIWPPIPKVASLSHSRGLMSTLTCKTHMFCKILLFRSFFFFLILLQNCCKLQQILYGRCVSSRWNARLCANHINLYGSRHPFFKEAALGRPKVWYCRQFHFFETCFLMLASFLASAFWGGQLAQSLTKPYKFTVMMGGHWICPPLLGGVSLGAPCASCIIKTMVFA